MNYCVKFIKKDEKMSNFSPDHQEMIVKNIYDTSVYHPVYKSYLQKEKEIQPVGRILSKKQRKRLEKIVDIKQKKVINSRISLGLTRVFLKFLSLLYVYYCRSV